MLLLVTACSPRGSGSAFWMGFLFSLLGHLSFHTIFSQTSVLIPDVDTCLWLWNETVCVFISLISCLCSILLPTYITLPCSYFLYHTFFCHPLVPLLPINSDTYLTTSVYLIHNLGFLDSTYMLLKSSSETDLQETGEYMQQHFIERAAALPSKARAAESRGLWPTLPAGAGRSPQFPCATCRKELSDCPVKPVRGESL